jgi:hypothetical protein
MVTGEALVVRDFRTTFNPPPNWPVPQDFRPYPGWEPDPDWGLPPPGWAMWITTEKQSHAVRWVLVAMGLFVACATGSCVGLVARGASEAARQQRSVVAAPAGSSCQGRTYPDQQPDHDICANPAGVAELPGLAISASPLRRSASESLCQDVTVTNHGDAPVGFRLRDWQLRAPSGEAQRGAVDTAGNLTSGELVKGDQQHGTLCFDPLDGRGTFVTAYQPLDSPHRAIWLSTVD